MHVAAVCDKEVSKWKLVNLCVHLCVSGEVGVGVRLTPRTVDGETYLDVFPFRSSASVDKTLPNIIFSCEIWCANVGNKATTIATHPQLKRIILKEVIPAFLKPTLLQCSLIKKKITRTKVEKNNKKRHTSFTGQTFHEKFSFHVGFDT